jgi:uncharacterized protein
MNEPEHIANLLDNAQTWFIVGLGNNPERAAFGVARILQQHGKRIVPIHPRAEVVHGEQGYPTIADAVAAVGAPDVVDVFVRSDRAGAFADQAIAARAKAVWFQLGVIDDDAVTRVEAADMIMIQNHCPAIEFSRR